MRVASLDEATQLFNLLPDAQRVATLSPAYVEVDAKRDPSLEAIHLVHGGKIGFYWMHSVLKGRVPNSDYNDLQSAYGYGGPVTNTNDNDFLEEAYQAYTDYAEENNIIAEFVRLHPCVSHAYVGQTQFNRQTIYLPKSGITYSATCRNMLKKAEREKLIAVQGTRPNILNFATSYHENLDRLKADKFYYFNNEYFQALSKLECAVLIVVELDREWLSAGIFLKGATFWEYHLGCTNERGRKLAATNLLIDSAYYAAQQEGKGLFLGGGKTPHDSDPLFKFKACFNGRETRYFTGSQIFKPEPYYALLDEFEEVGAVNPKTLFWR